MNKEDQIRRLLALKARHHRALEALIEDIEQMNEATARELNQKIDLISNKIKNELNEND